MVAGGPRIARRSLLEGAVALAATSLGGRAIAAPGKGGGPVIQSLTAPGGRAVAVTQWQPAGKPVGVILFSHGSGSSPRYYDRMIDPMVAAGWRVLAPLHVDSREHPDTAKYPGLSSWKARIEDMRLLIGEIGEAPFVAAGHSYGGLTALMLGGSQPVTPEGISGRLATRLAKAVVAFSPPAAVPGLISKEGFAQLSVPALIQTGTLDILPGFSPDGPDGWKSHLDAFNAARPGGGRYGLVLEGANHYFGGAICDPKRPGPPQLAQLDLANERTGLFLDGYGLEKGRARRRLDALVTDAFPARLMKR